jgi:cytochrome c biogenesis protein CcdA
VFPRISSADEEILGYTSGCGARCITFSEAPCLHGSVVPAGVTVMLGLYNPPRQGCGKPAKPGLLYPLVWIPCCGVIFAEVVKQSRLLNK